MKMIMTDADREKFLICIVCELFQASVDNIESELFFKSIIQELGEEKFGNDFSVDDFLYEILTTKV